eukprot:Hpha_TRINITY_DN20827_c0_g1::TRINITY_DN20827_c0_g1_i1::g.85658::m.85658
MAGTIKLSETVSLPRDGLTDAQVAGLEAVAAEWNEKAQTVVAQAERYEILLQEIEAKNQMLASKDEFIASLRDTEASDVASFKEKFEKELRELQQKYEQAMSSLASRESEVRTLSLEKTRLSQQVTLLTLKGEGEGSRDRGDEGKTTEQVRDLEARERTLSETLAEREEAMRGLQQRLRQCEDELRDAQRLAHRAQSERERATQDIEFFRATVATEREKQAAAIEEANKTATDALEKLREERAKSAELQGKLRGQALALEEAELQRNRLAEDLERAKKEIEALQNMERALHLELRKLEIISNQRDGANTDLRRQLQERQRSSDSQREKVEQLAGAVQEGVDRLRDVNDEIERLLHPHSASSAETRSASELAVFPEEVGRVVQFREDLEALLQMQDWERREQEMRLAREEEEKCRRIEELEAQVDEVEEGLLQERTAHRILKEMLRTQAEEVSARERMVEQEAAERAQGANEVQLFLMQESAGRAEIRDREGSAWELLLRNAEAEAEWARQRAKKRPPGWMGLEISEGTTIRTGAVRHKVGLTHEGRVVDLQGVKVFSVADHGPAHRAGVETDDVIIEVQGKPVRTLANFRAQAKEVHPGDTVRLSVYRESWGQTRRVDVITIQESFTQGHRRTITQTFRVQDNRGKPEDAKKMEKGSARRTSVHRDPSPPPKETVRTGRRTSESRR